jgi:hypothetical protein
MYTHVACMRDQLYVRFTSLLQLPSIVYLIMVSCLFATCALLLPLGLHCVFTLWMEQSTACIDVIYICRPICFVVRLMFSDACAEKEIPNVNYP